MKIRALLAAAGAGFVMAFAAAPASADLIFTLTDDHCTGLCGPGPFGTVLVHDLGGGQVTITETLNSGFRFVNSCCDALSFNIGGSTSIAVSGLTAGFNLLSTTAGSIMEDGTGNYMYAIGCTICGSGGSNPQPGPLSFSLTLTGVTSASFTANTAGNFFASDICAWSAAAGCGNTGAVTTGTPGIPPQQVPEPGILSLLALAVLGLGFTTMRRRTA
jgi:hypothetical protein